MADLFNPDPPPLASGYAYGVIDTETSGLFKAGFPDHADGQPRLAAFALIRTSPTFSVQSQDLIFIRPDGWTMEPQATEVNGLTDQFLRENGRPVKDALDLYEAAILGEGRCISGFNIKFDLRIMRAELVRAGRDDLLQRTYSLCTMQKLVGVVRARRNDGRIKTPKLWEALKHFKLPQIGAHTAAGDAIGALSLLKMMAQIGIDMTPELQKEPKNATTKTPRARPAEEAAGGKAPLQRPDWLRQK